MNIEIANRLVNLRKENGLSQEQLAEKIGVSRQAVSKWERSEASPDTDNIILLARLYNISLDELLRTDDEIPVSVDENETPAEKEPFPLPEESEKIAEVQNPETPIEELEEPDEKPENPAIEQKTPLKKQLGAMLNEWWKGLNLHVGLDGIYTTEDMSDEEYRKWHSDRSKFAIGAMALTILLAAIFICIDPFGWNYIVILLAPLPVIACSLESAIKSRNPARFAYPVLILEIFLFILCEGFDTLSLLLWLTVPVYYWVCRALKKQSLGTYFFPCLTIVIYIAAGLMADLWIYGLIVFAAIPLYSFIKKNFRIK